jgi:hypothetical protein
VISVASRAVNKLLLREGGQWVTGDLVSGFGSDDSGESPTGTTLSLVLDSDDGTRGDPVNVTGLGEVVLDSLFVSFGGLESESSVLGQEFLLGQVRELVKSDGVGLGGELLSGDSEEVLVEDSKSVGLLGWGSVALSVLHGPLSESGVDWSWDIVSAGAFDLEKTGSNQKCGSSNDDEDFVHFVYYFYLSVYL